MNSRELVEKILDSADVKINGDRPWDIQVHDERLYDRVLSQSSLGLGEAYMDGWWDCEDLSTMFYKVFMFSNVSLVYNNFKNISHVLKAKLFNLQTKRGSKKVAEEHYDLGNDLYMAFLDPYNQYTCGYFKNTNDLNKAQEQKLDLICKKLKLKPTDRVLDIGCGWGGFAKYAAEHYGCHITGISISDEQIKYAKEFTSGLPVEILKMDYRDLSGQYDKILICGMIEHVGWKNYKKIIQIVKKHISKDGLFLLHTIGNNKPSFFADQWVVKYIFPNSVLPSVKQIAIATEGQFIMEDWQNFGQYYDPTLLAWYKNFDESWPNFKEKYGERFYRMFRYYLLSFAGSFRARNLQLWQIVLSPNGVVGGYESVR